MPEELRPDSSSTIVANWLEPMTRIGRQRVGQHVPERRCGVARPERASGLDVLEAAGCVRTFARTVRA